MKMDGASRESYSVVIPVYNEKDVIIASLDEIERYLDGLKLDYEIVLVDDGSTDGTAGIISCRMRADNKIKLVRSAVNEGKGSAVRKGVFGASGDFIIFMDADLSTSPDQVSKMISSPDRRGNILVGVRGGEGVKVVRPFIRKAISVLYGIAVNALFRLNISDPGCGFKCFPAGIARELFGSQQIKDWVFDVEVMLRARARRIGVVEIPVSWVNHFPSRLNIIPDLIYCAIDLGKLFYLKVSRRL